MVDKILTPSSQLILGVIRLRGRSSQKELMECTGLSERNIRNSLKQLKNKKMIAEVRDPLDGRRKEYKVKIK